uniref:NADH-ubiquinone oxidoreductase chain 4 n=1 Tax=Clavelina lepadiformis TaxID=159417 RepID=C6GCR5_CLALP|nr:NADH dehydrogenase subunit 4 [Clavelina lepadiformis]ACO40304.1 NADH dehydrogenase subunit 4 [Clavelina lepadiformis]
MLFISLGLFSLFGLGKNKYMWVFFYSFLFCLYYMKFLFSTGSNLFSGQFMSFHFDTTCFFLFYLTVWVCLFSFLPMMYSEKNTSFIFFIMITTILLLLFSTNNMYVFFILFELSLVPIIIIITSWGSYKERIFSAYYFLLYTMITAVPFLIVMAVITFFGFSGYLFGFLKSTMIGGYNIPWYMMLAIALSFMSKLPVYGLHIWLPKAHVDAPVGGSMILAGVLLKLGGYGFLRVIFIINFMPIAFFLVFLGVIGYLVTAIICLRQVDMKILVAYSSVNHMSLSFSGIFSYFFFGFKGSYYMFFGHGIVSPMMFFFVHFLVFRSLTRLIHGNKGFFSIYSIFMFLMFFFFVINLGVPPFMNFFGEFGVVSSLAFFNNFTIVLILYGFMMSGVYIYNFFTTISQGKPNWGLFSKKGNMNEMLLCAFSFIGIVLSSFFLDILL